jgi:hypothetical protein
MGTGLSCVWAVDARKRSRLRRRGRSAGVAIPAPQRPEPIAGTSDREDSLVVRLRP